MNKFFNGRKYFLSKDNRWVRTTGNQERLSHDVWNFFYPNDPILKGDGYIIHHKNGDSSDDRIENLQKMMNSKHTGMHNIGNQNNLGKHWSNETKQKMSEVKLGRVLTEETKQKISDKMLGHIVSDETKQKMSEVMIGNQNRMGKHHTDETKRKMSEAKLGNKNPNWKGGKK